MANERVLFLEFVVAERCRNDRAHFFPFYAGLARDVGVPWRWIVYGTDFTFDPEIDRFGYYRVDMPEADRTTLEAELRAFLPTHIISSEILGPELKAVVERVVPDAWFVPMSDWLYFGGGARRVSDPYVDRRGASLKLWETLTVDPETVPFAWMVPPHGPGDPCSKTTKARCPRCRVPGSAHGGCVVAGGRYLLDVVPEYDARMMNHKAFAIRPFLRVMGGHSCTSKVPLKPDGFLAGIDLSQWSSPFGCTFCNVTGLDSRAIRYPRPHVEFAVSQLRRVRATIGTEGRNCREYDIFDTHVFFEFGTFFETLVADDFPPGTFHFSPRIDDFLKVLPQLEAWLPRLVERDWTINILRMGFENFSEAEQLRFNKGITLDQQRRALETVTDLARRYPEHFHHNGFGFILFSPWTTLDDVEDNLRIARELGYYLCGHAVASCIQMDARTPMRYAAQRDGLLVEEAYDPAFLYDTWRTEAWRTNQAYFRFAEPRVDLLFRTLVRVVAYQDRELYGCPFLDTTDEGYRLAIAFLEALGEEESRPPRFAWTLLRAVRELSDEDGMAELLAAGLRLYRDPAWRAFLDLDRAPADPRWLASEDALGNATSGNPNLAVALTGGAPAKAARVDPSAPPPLVHREPASPGARLLAAGLTGLADGLDAVTDAPLRGWRLDEVEAEWDADRFGARFVLRRGDERLGGRIEPAAQLPEAFCRSARLGLVYTDPPPRTPESAAALRAFCAFVEGRLPAS